MSFDENHVAIVSFHGAVKREAAKVRAMLRDADIGGTFYLHVEVSGRIQDGDVSLAYKLSDNSYGPKVEGNELNAVLQEFLRRNGWEKVHAPKAIADLTKSDEIPF